jgi:hypothetical protein
MTPEELAQLFHETYERLAPEHGYETRKDSAVPWKDVPPKNKGLMIAVTGVVLEEFAKRIQQQIPSIVNAINGARWNDDLLEDNEIPVVMPPHSVRDVTMNITRMGKGEPLEDIGELPADDEEEG